MIGATVAFAFAALGSKVLLGFAAVYCFIPDAHECSRCDGQTTAVELPSGTRTVGRALGLQSRWCPGCGETFLARGRRPPTLWVGRPERTRVRPVPPAQVFERRPQ